MSIAISSLAFAGATAFTVGAALPAGAQTVSAAPQHINIAPVDGFGCFGGCFCDDFFDDFDC
ncbi:MAG: hypothetical protein ACJ72W_21395 [Actinoallomurus sp.]